MARASMHGGPPSRLIRQNQKQDTSEMKPVNRAARRALKSNKATKPTNKKWQRV